MNVLKANESDLHNGEWPDSHPIYPKRRQKCAISIRFNPQKGLRIRENTELLHSKSHPEHRPEHHHELIQNEEMLRDQQNINATSMEYRCCWRVPPKTSA